MFDHLKKHPFAVEAYFENSWVFTFAVLKEELQPLIPECLRLDTCNDKWAFIAVALVETKNLRPKGFPKFLGNNFMLVGYRVFVRYTNEKGKNLRGLYILKSETNKKKMEFLGNFFTKYNYKTIDVSFTKSANYTEINASNFNLKLNTLESEQLPENSPFPNWKMARRYAGPLPFTFSFNKANNEVLIVEGVRKNWKPKPINVISYKFPFFKELNINSPILANAFVIEKIPYQWKKGKIERWIP